MLGVSTEDAVYWPRNGSKPELYEGFLEGRREEKGENGGYEVLLIVLCTRSCLTVKLHAHPCVGAVHGTTVGGAASSAILKGRGINSLTPMDRRSPPVEDSLL